ncbi:21532_t:CDS:2, partial [Dentiscutata erythropus]
CTICLEYMSNPCTISCGHTFCYHCLYKWFKKQKKCLTCRVKITVAPVLSFAIKEIIDHFVRIKSLEEETRLEKKKQEFKAISNPWDNLFGNSNNTETKPKNKRSYEEIEDDEIEIEDDSEIEIEEIDDYSEYDNYDTSDSFIDDEEIEEIYTDEDEYDNL